MKKFLNTCVLISCMLIILGLVSAGWAANYYVDYAGGHESASGANPTTALAGLDSAKVMIF